MLLWGAYYITIPLGKIHRHDVDVLTIYRYHSVNSIAVSYTHLTLPTTPYV